MFTQKDLTNVIREVTLRVPQAEPFFFVIPLEVVPYVEYVTTISPMATAAVTATRAVFCDTFMESLTMPQRCGLLLHEMLHPALGHLSDPFVDNSIDRARFKKLSNRAQDYVIENLIYEMGEAESPNLPADKRPIQCNYKMTKDLFRFKGMSWRQVYEVLRGEPQKDEQLDSHDFLGDLPPELNKVWEAAQEESARISAGLAAGDQKGAGSIPIKPAAPVITWKDMLKEYLTSLPAPSRKSWSKINRRVFSTTRECRPTHIGSAEALDKVYLLVDTSGSMLEWLPKAAGDTLNLFKVVAVGSVEIVYYDVGIQRQVKLERDDLEDYTIESMPGGGGTQVRLALEELIASDDFNPDSPIVVLTDGYDDYHVGNLTVGPLIWISYSAEVVSDRGLCFTVKED